MTQPELRLAPETRIVPVADLPATLRAELEASDEHFAISARQTRQTTRLVSAEAAELVRQFETPSTLADGVRQYAADRDENPETVLRNAWSVLENLMRAGLLLQTGDPRLERPPALVAGDTLPASQGESRSGWQIVRPIQRFEDSEVYVVRGCSAEGEECLGVLKIDRGSTTTRAPLEHEARILAHLGENRAGALAPRLLDAGEHDGQPFLVSEWCAGLGLEPYGARLRQVGSGTGAAALDRPAFARLAHAVADAYARLHAAGILHGDVHPGNLKIDRRGRAWLLDFGIAHRLEDDRPLLSGGGVPFYRAPEVARCLAEDDPAPIYSAQGEQFSVAALLYRTLTGHHYRDFSLDQEQQLAQASEAGMRPFRHRGLEDWPAMEAILARALAADPADRFADMATLAQAFDNLLEVEPRSMEPRSMEPMVAQPAARDGASKPQTPLLDRRARQIRASLEPEGPWWSQGIRSPTASVQNGAAGIALACLRMASLDGDGHLLALADLWSRRAREWAKSEAADELTTAGPDETEAGAEAETEAGAETETEPPARPFDAPDLELTEATVGRASPQHTESGVHAVDARVAHALGHDARRDRAVERYLLAIDRPARGLDLTLGSASVLPISADLLAISSPGAVRDRLLAEGRARVEALWQELDREPTLRASGIDSPSLAHGWAGLLYATLRWQQAVANLGSDDGGRLELPDRFVDRVDQWAEIAEPMERGTRWPWRMGPAGCAEASMPGWCNGTAGHLLLACELARTFDSSYRELAESAAWDVWDATSPSASLCCGQVGRAYGLLSYFRLGGEVAWLERAARLAELAAVGQGFEGAPAHSLFKGELALAVLECDLRQPESSAFPFVEGEGWSSAATRPFSSGPARLGP